MPAAGRPRPSVRGEFFSSTLGKFGVALRAHRNFRKAGIHWHQSKAGFTALTQRTPANSKSENLLRVRRSTSRRRVFDAKEMRFPPSTTAGRPCPDGKQTRFRPWGMSKSPTLAQRAWGTLHAFSDAKWWTWIMLGAMFTSQTSWRGSVT